MEPVYRSLVLLGKGTIRAMDWRILVSGAEHIPADGPGVLVANHVSYLDPIMLGYAGDLRGRYVRFLAKRELFDVPGLGRLLRRMRQVPVDRHGGALAAVDAALRALRAGELVAVFPEATISPAFMPRSGKTGAARIALTAGAPLLPVALWGGQRMLTKGRPRQLRRGVPLTVHVAPPLPYAADEDAGAVTRRLMDALRALVEDAARTYPDEPAGPDDLWWVPRHLGGTAPTVEEAAVLMRADAERRRAGRRVEERRG